MYFSFALFCARPRNGGAGRRRVPAAGGPLPGFPAGSPQNFSLFSDGGALPGRRHASRGLFSPNSEIERERARLGRSFPRPRGKPPAREKVPSDLRSVTRNRRTRGRVRPRPGRACSPTAEFGFRRFTGGALTWNARTCPRFGTTRHVASGESGDMSPQSKSGHWRRLWFWAESPPNNETGHGIHRVSRFKRPVPSARRASSSRPALS
jgi:hypothetical protein